MSVIQRTAQAEEDLLDIWAYIALDNINAADNVLDQIEDKLLLLADNPLIGQSRTDIAPELHHFPVGSYLILYRPMPSGIEVVRVVEGSRNLPNLV